MKAADLRPRHWAQSLRVRLIAFLTIALLPLGAVAVFQTVRVITEAERLAERDVLTRTDRAASAQEAVLRRAYGAAYGLGNAAAELQDDPEVCSNIMRQFVEARPNFVFAGFIAADGVMVCNSAEMTIDYAGQPSWEAFVADPTAIAEINDNGDASGEAVLIAFVPIFDLGSGAFLGGQAISIPNDNIITSLANNGFEVDLALINSAGEVLATSTGLDDITRFERLGIVPASLDASRSGVLLRTRDEMGARQPAAVIPLIPGRIYVLGLWQGGESPQAVSLLGTALPAFPVLMWLASLVVAYLTINGLILRPLRALSHRMNTYDPEGGGGDFKTIPDAPKEIRQIADSYNALVHRIAAEQARLETSIEEKELLLREVHHRVKNNLQLISSILNMQMRGLSDPGAVQVLTKVQDRVMSLSTIHKALYTGTKVDEVRADKLLREIINGVLNIGLPKDRIVDVAINLDPVVLDPDQAVPLSLLVTEAVTNAAKYIGEPKDGAARIEITLSETKDGPVTLRVMNSQGGDIGVPLDEDGTGLGERLIAAFASQLGSDLQRKRDADQYEISVSFEKI